MARTSAGFHALCGQPQMVLHSNAFSLKAANSECLCRTCYRKRCAFAWQQVKIIFEVQHVVFIQHFHSLSHAEEPVTACQALKMECTIQTWLDNQNIVTVSIEDCACTQVSCCDWTESFSLPSMKNRSPLHLSVLPVSLLTHCLPAST